MDSNDLWTAFGQGDPHAREALLNAHLGLVHHVARQVARGLTGEPDFDELLSAGSVGLMKALENFDLSRGLAFSTFAAPRIRGAILDELRSQDHVPRSIRRKTKDIAAAKDRLTRRLARPATDREVASELEIDLETFWRWKGDVEGAVHLPLERRSQESADDRGLAPAEYLVSESHEEVEERINRAEEVERMREAILKLKEQERIVLTLYYFEELKLVEIAQILELTESRVSQIRSKAVSRLRGELRCLRPLSKRVAA